VGTRASAPGTSPRTALGVRRGVLFYVALALSACEPCTRLPRSGHSHREPQAVPASVEHNAICGENPDAAGCNATPRCAAADPDCGPVPSRHFDGCYRPGDARQPLFARSSRGRPDCSHDGDCLLISGGCTFRCVSYALQEPVYGSICLLESWMERDDLLCGCVAGHCSWFTQ
jgi:hypothetical protein